MKMLMYPPQCCCLAVALACVSLCAYPFLGGGAESGGGSGAQNSTNAQGLKWTGMFLAGNKMDSSGLCCQRPVTCLELLLAEQQKNKVFFLSFSSKPQRRRRAAALSVYIILHPCSSWATLSGLRRRQHHLQVIRVCSPHKIRVILGQRGKAPKKRRWRRLVPLLMLIKETCSRPCPLN